MKLFVVLTSIIFISACTSSPVVSDRVPASDSASDSAEVQNHPELKIELPFDPIYCDLNNNNKIDEDEIQENNIRSMNHPNENCQTLESEQTLFSEKPIASLGLQRGQLVLTVDDGPNQNVTPQILDLLDQYHIQATFFVVGSRIPSHQNLIRELVRRGHTVGSHTFSHDVPNITAQTIAGEILKGHKALVEALGHQPEGRILFRAPGLGWSVPKAIVLNNNATTRSFIGPIHANIGTDAPAADWSCWSRGVSAEQCASMYYQDIMNHGRGIVLSHDIFYKAGRGNTYEMLRILLNKLDTQGGGISNRRGQGVWSFVKLADQHALDQFDIGRGNTAPPAAPATPAASGVVQFRKQMNLRTDALAQIGAITDDSLVILQEGFVLTTGQFVDGIIAGPDLVVGKSRFKKVQIRHAKPGFENFQGQVFYISAGAF